MKKILLISMMGLLLFCGRSEDEKKTLVSKILEDSAKMVIPSLMEMVTQRAQEEGYAKAVKFCNINLPDITQKRTDTLRELFREKFKIKDYSIMRSSLKIRNPANAPDAAMKKVLEDWETLRKSGKEPVTTVIHEGDTWYGMKPIAVNSPLCLNCHGNEKDIRPDILKTLKENYPLDQATGYSLGGLRGALVTKIIF